MPKPDAHIISEKFIAGLCFTCEEPLPREIHCGTLEDIKPMEGWTSPPLFCAEHCPLCREGREK